MNSRARILMICINRRLRMYEPSCAGRGSEALADRLEKEIQSRKINLTVERSSCMGYCRTGPVIRLVPGATFYLAPSDNEIAALLDEAETLCGNAISDKGKSPDNLLT